MKIYENIQLFGLPTNPFTYLIPTLTNFTVRIFNSLIKIKQIVLEETIGWPGVEQIGSEVESLIYRLGLKSKQEVKCEILRDYLIKAREIL
ncbi:MAG: hypothetical protein ACW99Q_16955 [Candidatus Kariarchaeaceae archaeon]